MSKNTKVDNSEINLMDLFEKLYEGKWIIVSAIAISVIFGNFYQSTRVENFTATTQINPMSTIEENKYILLNTIVTSTMGDMSRDYTSAANINGNTDNVQTNELIENFFYAARQKFLNLYTEELNQGELFEKAIRKFNLLNKNEYSEEKAYNEAIIKLASSIKIIRPIINEKNRRSEISPNIIKFTYHDPKKWKNVLLYVDDLANKNIKKNLQNELKTYLSIKK